MRLAFLTSHPIQYYAPLYRALTVAGIDLTVLFCHHHGVEPSLDRGFGRSVRFDVPLLEGYRHEFLANLSPKSTMSPWGLVNPSVVSHLSRDRYDAVIVAGYSYVTALLAVLAPARRKAKILLHGDSNPYPRRSLTKRALKQIVLRPLFSLVDHFLAMGMRNAEYYRQYGVEDQQMTIAPYPVDTMHFATGAADARTRRTDVRRSLGLSSNGPAFLFCAKLISRKRPLDAIRAFAYARRSGPCCLAIVGSGQLEAAVRAEVKHLGVAADVALLGFRNQSELPAIYGVCDALIVPSDNEPWGVVINEAMAGGLAIAASDRVGAAVDLVRGNGFIFPAGKVEALATGLSAWVKDCGGLEAAKEASGPIIAAWGLEKTVRGMILGVERALAG